MWCMQLVPSAVEMGLPGEEPFDVSERGIFSLLVGIPGGFCHGSHGPLKGCLAGCDLLLQA